MMMRRMTKKNVSGIKVIRNSESELDWSWSLSKLKIIAKIKRSNTSQPSFVLGYQPQPYFFARNHSSFFCARFGIVILDYSLTLLLCNRRMSLLNHQARSVVQRNTKKESHPTTQASTHRVWSLPSSQASPQILKT